MNINLEGTEVGKEEKITCFACVLVSQINEIVITVDRPISVENAAIVNYGRLERFRCGLHSNVIGKGEGGWGQEKLREKRGTPQGELPCPITSAVQANSDENSWQIRGLFLWYANVYDVRV